MIVCSCAVISDSDIEQALVEILSQPNAPLPTPGVVFRHLQKQMVCCGCSPLAVSTIYEKVDELAERLPRMTRDDVNAAVRRHLTPENLRIAVIADPEGAAHFVDGLSSNAPSPIVYETETKPEVVSEDRTIAIDVRLAVGRIHDLLVGYAVPTPTWKAAYRVVE